MDKYAKLYGIGLKCFQLIKPLILGKERFFLLNPTWLCVQTFKWRQNGVEDTCVQSNFVLRWKGKPQLTKRTYVIGR
jgi:hypothetical protein